MQWPGHASGGMWLRLWIQISVTHTNTHKQTHTHTHTQTRTHTHTHSSSWCWCFMEAEAQDESCHQLTASVRVKGKLNCWFKSLTDTCLTFPHPSAPSSSTLISVVTLCSQCRRVVWSLAFNVTSNTSSKSKKHTRISFRLFRQFYYLINSLCCLEATWRNRSGRCWITVEEVLVSLLPTQTSRPVFLWSARVTEPADGLSHPPTYPPIKILQFITLLVDFIRIKKSWKWFVINK